MARRRDLNGKERRELFDAYMACVKPLNSKRGDKETRRLLTDARWALADVLDKIGWENATTRDA